MADAVRVGSYLSFDARDEDGPYSMASPITSVSRFWSLRDGRIVLGDSGFLSDPEGSPGNLLNPDLKTLSAILNSPCLVLLGEPGIGKTTAMERERVAVQRGVTESGDLLIWQDLAVYDQGDASRLRDDVFGDSQWQSWQDGNQTLHLFLDSFDECRLYLRNVANLLLDGFRRLPHHDRLVFRITCRTGAWSQHIEDGLRSIWKDAEVAVHELAPLRRVDVVEIAASTGIDDVDGFLREIEELNVVPFAIKPVTLNFLIAIYKRVGRFPSTQAQLYDEGCRALCEETSPSRRAAGQFGTLDGNQRLAIASRVAAMTMFCGRDAIWVGIESGQRPTTDLGISAISGEAESVDGHSFEVTTDAVRDVICDTGLFTSRGANRMGWAHRTYAEYLAARYLHERGLTLEQVKSLLLHPQMQTRVVPQLWETTAWLAGLDPAVFTLMLDRDPRVLLFSDVANRATDDCQALVSAILQAAECHLLTDVRPPFGRLSHPDLASQLRPYIRDSSKGLMVRRMTIDIAESATCNDCLDDLLYVMLDENDFIQIRVKAARAIVALGGDTAAAKFRELLNSSLEADTEDDLRGCALRGLWPDELSITELFRHITEPKKNSYYGAYVGFLRQDLTKHLNSEDLCHAVNWAASQERRRRLPLDLVHLIDDIILKSWECFNVPGLLECLANLIHVRLRFHKSLVEPGFGRTIPADFPGSDEKRRRFLSALVVVMGANNERFPGGLSTTSPPLLNQDDLVWLVERLDAEPEHPRRVIWSKLIACVFRAGGYLPFDPVYHAAQRHGELAEELPDLVRQPVRIDSDEAEQMRVQYREDQEWQVHDRERPQLDPPPKTRVQKLLVSIESGNFEAWWHLTRVLTLEATSTHIGDYFNSDLTTLPGWQDADAAIRQRIIDAGLAYVEHEGPDPDAWFDDAGMYHHPAGAGYKAVRLLLLEAPNALAHFSTGIWIKWTPILVAYPIGGSDEGEGVQQELVKRAYDVAPQTAIAQDWWTPEDY